MSWLIASLLALLQRITHINTCTLTKQCWSPCLVSNVPVRNCGLALLQRIPVTHMNTLIDQCDCHATHMVSNIPVRNCGSLVLVGVRARIGKWWRITVETSCSQKKECKKKISVWKCCPYSWVWAHTHTRTHPHTYTPTHTCTHQHTRIVKTLQSPCMELGWAPVSS